MYIRRRRRRRRPRTQTKTHTDATIPPLAPPVHQRTGPRFDPYLTILTSKDANTPPEHLHSHRQYFNDPALVSTSIASFLTRFRHIWSNAQTRAQHLAYAVDPVHSLRRRMPRLSERRRRCGAHGTTPPRARMDPSPTRRWSSRRSSRRLSCTSVRASERVRACAFARARAPWSSV